jgi:hypothetical protein
MGFTVYDANFSPIELRFQPNPETIGLALAGRQMAAYVLGNLNLLAEGLAAPSANLPPEFRFQGLLALGRAKDAIQDPSLQQILQGPWQMLCLSISLRAEGEAAEAEQYRQKACAGLDCVGRNGRRAAELLRRAKPPGLREFDEVVAEPSAKALLAIALAWQFSAERATFAARARQLAVSRMPPYLLVQKALAWLP